MLFRECIYINEEQKYLRSKRENTKEWFNSYLTYQNLKNTSSNNIHQYDRDNMWLAIYDEINSVDASKSKRTDDTEIFKILPQDDFNFILNSKTEHRNARLFKVHMVCTLN